MSLFQSFMFFILGAFLWTFTEYVLHRFLGHVKKPVLVRTRFHKEHTKHHLIRDYFASSWDKLLMLVIISPLLFSLSYALTSFWNALFFTLGFALMYLTYEVVHLRLHIAAPIHSYASRMRAHHFYHHFVDEKMNHGVTTPFWDKVFGTYRAPGIITYPSKFRLNWIEQSPTGRFQDPWGQRYQQRESNSDNNSLHS
jgi:sterol desaturase/sphingolipid hydroxylase (fatty acid hydroxylase superfamily)